MLVQSVGVEITHVAKLAQLMLLSLVRRQVLAIVDSARKSNA
jgi:hypothetical protein